MNKETLTLVITKAIIARDAIRKLVKNGMGPKTKVPALLEFQKKEGSLDADSFYGPNSEAALTYYLSKMSDNVIPKSHTAYSKTPVTWKPPVMDVVKVAVEAKPVVTETPKAKPKAKKKKVAAKPKGGDNSILKGLNKNVVSGLSEVAKTQKKIQNKKASDKIKEDMPVYGQDSINGDLDAEDVIAAPIEEIKKLLALESSRNTATFEHNQLVAQKDILERLKDIQSRVKSVQDNPLVRAKDYRVLGLFI